MKIRSILRVGLAAPLILTAIADPTGNRIDNSNYSVVSGLDLVHEMQQLQLSLTNLQSLLENSLVQNDPLIMDKAAKLFRRARWLVYATHNDGNEMARISNQRKLRQQMREERKRMRQERELLREEREERELEGLIESRANLRGASVESVEEDELEREEPEFDDDIKRTMYDTTITFPECKGLFLEECLNVLSQELATLQMDCEIIIHEKRSADQPGYNKVVIVTNLAADRVTGRNNDGIVSYPFMWDSTILGLRTLGVDGKWDCNNATPEHCCDLIKASAPYPDVKGNYIECHIFVPFGGVGNKKRSDRVFVNLSQDGRVHEPPIVQ